MTYNQLSITYAGIVLLCLARADDTKAYITFFNRKTKAFRSADKAEKYILRKYKSIIL